MLFQEKRTKAIIKEKQHDKENKQHTAFDSIFHDDFIAQQISVAPEIEVNYLGNNIKFKYDLRCYAYQDQLQLVIARLYQGQTTNLATPGGGFACVVFS